MSAFCRTRRHLRSKIVQCTQIGELDHLWIRIWVIFSNRPLTPSNPWFRSSLGRLDYSCRLVTSSKRNSILNISDQPCADLKTLVAVSNPKRYHYMVRDQINVKKIEKYSSSKSRVRIPVLYNCVRRIMRMLQIEWVDQSHVLVILVQKVTKSSTRVTFSRHCVVEYFSIIRTTLIKNLFANEV